VTLIVVSFDGIFSIQPEVISYQ